MIAAQDQNSLVQNQPQSESIANSNQVTTEFQATEPSFTPQTPAQHPNRLPMLLTGLALAAVVILGGLLFLLQPEQNISLSENPAENKIDTTNNTNSGTQADPSGTLSLLQFITPPKNQLPSPDNETRRQEMLGDLNPTPSEIQLTVEWQEPVAIDPTTYFSGDEFIIPENPPEYMDQSIYSFDPVEKLNETYSIYNVGTVLDSDLAGYSVVLIQRSSQFDFGFGGGSLLYRALVSPDQQQKIILTDLSNTLSEMDRLKFSTLENVGLADLRAPKSFSIQYNDKNLTFLARPFSTARTFSWWRENPSTQIRQLSTHPSLGPVYEDLNGGYFIVALADGSMQFYDLQLNQTQRTDSRYDFPESTYENISYEIDEYFKQLSQYTAVDITFTTNDSETVSNIYTFNERSSCHPLKVNAEYGNPQWQNWRGVGQLSDGSIVYQETEEVVTERLKNWTSFGDTEELVQNELANYSRLMTQDHLGRWITLTNFRFLGGAEADCFNTQNRAEAL